MSKPALVLPLLVVAAACFVLLPAGGTAEEASGMVVITAPDLQDAKVLDISRGTALAYTPDGRLLVTQRGGELLVFEDGALAAPGPSLDLTEITCSDQERGLLGLALDPHFAENRYIYVFYTFDKHGGCERQTQTTAVNRVSRFVLPDNNIVDPESEVVLLDNMPSYSGLHNAGDLEFGPDGYLYVTVGDSFCDFEGLSGCAGSNSAPRRLNGLVGKLLRVASDGSTPPDNPFVGPDSLPCRETGFVEAGKVCSETYAWGLRNPWRIAVKPGIAETVIYINDVGWNSWEEINVAVPGGDYGWNLREGFCVVLEPENCGPAPEGIEDPLFTYPREAPCVAVTAGEFIPAGAWGKAYDGAYIFGDYGCGKFWRLDGSGAGVFPTELLQVPSAGPVDMLFVPQERALYYVAYNGNQVHKVTYVPQPQEVFEGWNELRWWLGEVDAGGINAAVDATLEPDSWSAIAHFDGAQWRMHFREAPFPDLNTLAGLAPGMDLWLFSFGAALYEPLGAGGDLAQ